jgi:hypothetical protein
MKRIAVALVSLTFLALPFVEISAGERRGSRSFGHSKPSQFAGSVSQSGRFHASFGSRGLHPRFGPRHVHPHHFSHPKLPTKLFVPHHLGRHHVIRRRPGFHHGFFFGHRVIGIPSSSAVIWSHPGVMRGFTVPYPEPIINEGTLVERPLISIMLHYRHDLELSPQQVHDLEELRDRYLREGVRYDADLRIAEMELERLLKADLVDLEQVKVKLQEIEHLKTEIRFSRIRTIEQGKELLSPEQYEKLQSLLGESGYSRSGYERFSPSLEDKP